MSQTLVRIDAPHFVAGILCDDTEWRVCVKAAPIVRWMVGKPLPWIEGYCQEKGWLLDKDWDGIPSEKLPGSGRNG